MSRDKAILLDMLRAAQLIIEFQAGLDKAAFVDDLKTQSAILHQLLILGEAVKRLSPQFRQRHPEIPWRLIAGMRDRLIHEYDAVDLEEVWRTTTADIPHLITLLEPLIPTQK